MKRKLGRSGIEVSALGLGCMEIGGKMRDKEGYGLKNADKDKEPMFYLGEVDDEQSVRTLEYALDNGINFFDTAPAYGAGHSERILGRAFGEKRDKVVIATKFGKPIDEHENWFGRYPSNRELIQSIRSECEASLERLGADYIDLYQFHQMEFNLLEYADEVIEILERLVAEGKIRYYGWSTNNLECIQAFSQGEHYTATQHDLNVLMDAPQQIAICEEMDHASIVNGVLGMGFLSGKYTADNYRDLLSKDDFRLRIAPYFVPLLDKLDMVCDILTSGGRTVPQGALAWVWTRSGRCIPITGFRTFDQVKENIKAMQFGSLSSEQMQEINTLVRPAYRKENHEHGVW